MKKLAMIRQQGECPFGLPISKACKIVGVNIFKMQPIDETNNSKEAQNSNLNIFNNIKEISQCPFAANTLSNDTVVCNYNPELKMSDNTVPPEPFSNTNPIGMLNNYYSTNDDAMDTMYRNLYYGIYQQASKEDKIKLRKDIFKYFTKK